MVRTFLTVALLAAGCKSESAAKRETPSTTAEKAPVAPAPAPAAPNQTTEADARMKTELETLDQQVTAAANEVAGAQSDADRAAANAKLEQLKVQQSALKVKRMRALVPSRGSKQGAAPAPETMTGARDDSKKPTHE